MENVWGKGCSANTLFNHEVSEPAFSSKPSKHLHTQTVRAGEQLRTVKSRIIKNLNVVSLFSGNISGTDKFMWRNCVWSGDEFWQLSEVIFLRSVFPWSQIQDKHYLFVLDMATLAGKAQDQFKYQMSVERMGEKPWISRHVWLVAL